MHQKPFRRTKNCQFPIVALLGLMSVTSLAGCTNPNLADVRGVITLDGKPLPDAFVLYTPVSKGATSFGKTDANGYYRMKFSDTQRGGAFIGSNRVSIGTGDIAADNSGRTPEVVPSAYNTKTRLVAEVNSGRNTFDFDLKSDVSEVEQVEVDFD